MFLRDNLEQSSKVNSKLTHLSFDAVHRASVTRLRGRLRFSGCSLGRKDCMTSERMSANVRWRLR